MYVVLYFGFLAPAEPRVKSGPGSLSLHRETKTQTLWWVHVQIFGLPCTLGLDGNCHLSVGCENMHHIQNLTVCKFGRHQFETRALVKVHEHLRCEQREGPTPLAPHFPLFVAAFVACLCPVVRSVG